MYVISMFEYEVYMISRRDICFSHIYEMDKYKHKHIYLREDITKITFVTNMVVELIQKSEVL